MTERTRREARAPGILSIGACSTLTCTRTWHRRLTWRLTTEINLAISNPCVELWFVLHFQEQIALLGRHDAQRICGRHITGGKTLCAADLDELVERHEIAAERARLLERRHRENGNASDHNPSSGVWRLIDVVRQPSRV